MIKNAIILFVFILLHINCYSEGKVKWVKSNSIFDSENLDYGERYEVIHSLNQLVVYDGLYNINFIDISSGNLVKKIHLDHKGSEDVYNRFWSLTVSEESNNLVLTRSDSIILFNYHTDQFAGKINLSHNGQRFFPSTSRINRDSEFLNAAYYLPERECFVVSGHYENENNAEDEHISIWNSTTGELIKRISSSGCDFRIIDSGNKIMIFGGSAIWYYDLESGETSGGKEYIDYANRINISEDDKYIANNVRLYDDDYYLIGMAMEVRDRKNLDLIYSHELTDDVQGATLVNNIALLSRDSLVAFFCNNSMSLKLVNFHTGEEIYRWDSLNCVSPHWISFSPDGKELIYAEFYNSYVDAYNLDSGEKRSLLLSSGLISTVRYSNTGKYIGYITENGYCILKNESKVFKRGLSQIISDTDNSKAMLDFNGSDTRMVLSNWKYGSHSNIYDIYLDSDTIGSYAVNTYPKACSYSPDDRYFAYLMNNNELVVIDAETYQSALRYVFPHGMYPQYIYFGTNGQKLYCLAENKSDSIYRFDMSSFDLDTAYKKRGSIRTYALNRHFITQNHRFMSDNSRLYYHDIDNDHEYLFRSEYCDNLSVTDISMKAISNNGMYFALSQEGYGSSDTIQTYQKLHIYSREYPELGYAIDFKNSVKMVHYRNDINPYHDFEIISISWSPDDKYVVGATSGGDLILFEIDTTKLDVFKNTITLNGDSAIEFAPNPAGNRAELRCTGLACGQVKIIITDIFGRNFLNFESYYYGDEAFAKSLDCSALGSGIYLVIIKSGCETRTGKLVIKK